MPRPGATVSGVLRRTFPFLAAAVLVACGGGDDTSSSTATAPPTTAAVAATAAPVATAASEQSAVDPATVPAALQFTAPLVGGGEIEMGALAGRPVLLWFWAPW